MARSVIRTLVALGALLLGQQALAQTAYYWKAGCTGCTNQTSPMAAINQALSICQAQAATSPPTNCGGTSCTNASGDEFSLFDVTPGVWPAYQYRFQRFRPGTGAYCTGNQNSLTTTVRPEGPVTCPSAGTRRGSIQSGAAAAGDAVCGNDGCSYVIADDPPVSTELFGGAGTLVTVESQGRACNTSPQTADLPDAQNGGCVESGGNMACIDPQAAGGQGCGYFNADYVCTGHVPNNSCVQFASGGVACVAGAPDAPTESDGVTPAEPVGSVSNGTTTVNYYDSVTVNSSGTTVNTTAGQGGSAAGAPGRDGSAGGASGGSGGGDTIINCVEGTPCVVEESDDEGACPEGEDCSVTGPELGEVCTFGECAADFYDRVTSAPLVAAVLGVGAAMPSGTCPNWTLSAFESDYSLSAPMCDIWEQVSPVLSAIFLVIWAWVATRIVLSA